MRLIKIHDDGNIKIYINPRDVTTIKTDGKEMQVLTTNDIGHHVVQTDAVKKLASYFGLD